MLSIESLIEVMRSDIPVVEHRRKLDEALRIMQENGLPAGSALPRPRAA